MTVFWGWVPKQRGQKNDLWVLYPEKFDMFSVEIPKFVKCYKSDGIIKVTRQSQSPLQVVFFEEEKNTVIPRQITTIQIINAPILLKFGLGLLWLK